MRRLLVASVVALVAGVLAHAGRALAHDLPAAVEGSAATGAVRGESRPSSPRVTAPARVRLSTAIRRGVRLRVSCEVACRAAARLRAARSTLGTTRKRRIAAGATRTLTLRLNPRALKTLVGARRVRATLVARIRSGGETHTIRRRVVLRS
jgi:hypothetical protein